jgi:hypothetical protein
MHHTSAQGKLNLAHSARTLLQDATDKIKPDVRA